MERFRGFGGFEGVWNVGVKVEGKGLPQDINRWLRGWFTAMELAGGGFDTR